MTIDRALLKKIENAQHQTCFGCGSANPIGLHMEFLTAGQQLYSFVTVPETMAGWDRIVHGGILTTMLDEVMGWTAIHLLKKIAVTRTITVDFLKPVYVNKELLITGIISERPSERQAVVSGEIHMGDILCARARGDFATLSAQSAVRLGVMSGDYLKQFQPLLERTDD
ncbi:MAG: PaaI family thioesterase [Desulfobulbus sp.]|jgi:acyl-coenzyme A thioesterase PaaI-like protein|nr:PaaI family thioesterase [Desulfobulbus sp.]